MLSALLVGADVVGVFCKNFRDLDPQGDMQVRNPALWDSLPAITSVWKKVERWMRSDFVFGSGVRGESVAECEWPPVTYGLGQWGEEVEQGRFGRWFAFCNLARTRTWEEIVPWGELQFSYIPTASLEIDECSKARPDPVVEIGEEGLHLALAPGKWVVGRVVVQAGSGAVRESSVARSDLSITAAPNPSGSMTEFEVRAGQKQRIRLTVCDVAGRVVREIPAEVQPGTTRLQWDGRSGDGEWVPSGLFRAVIRNERGDGRRSCWVLRLK